MFADFDLRKKKIQERKAKEKRDADRKKKFALPKRIKKKKLIMTN